MGGIIVCGKLLLATLVICLFLTSLDTLFLIIYYHPLSVNFSFNMLHLVHCHGNV